ncbi:MAG TPA: 30S ribosomal protein S8 [Thermoanaerobaculia bacterium]|jgi:small subunit ribosomal protein S8|nr:30S ribosomal protein S8 [Thermoanaerobaculia bacterium]
MKTSDPLSDLLTRLRNGMRAGHDRVDVPTSRVKEAVLKVLEEEGYIGSFRKVQDAGKTVLRVGLKYDSDGEPIVSGLERVSRPGRRVYARADAIPSVLGGLGMSLVSTSRGILTDKKARQSRLGGEVLCNVW